MRMIINEFDCEKLRKVLTWRHFRV